LLCWLHLHLSQCIYYSYCQWRTTNFMAKISDNSQNFVAITKAKSLKTLLTTSRRHCTFLRTKYLWNCTRILFCVVISSLNRRNGTVKLVEYGPAKFLGWFRYPVGSYRRLPKRYFWLVQPPARDWYVGVRKRFTCVLPLTCHQCNIHCRSSRVTHGASKWRWVPRRPLATLRKEQKNRV